MRHATPHGVWARRLLPAVMILAAGLQAHAQTPAPAQADSPLPTCRGDQLRDAAGEPLSAMGATVVNSPAVGVTNSVELGQSMVATHNVAILPTSVRLAGEVRVAAKGFEVVIPLGRMRVDSRGGGGTYYRSDDGYLQYKGESKPRMGKSVGVFVSDNEDIDPKVYYIAGPADLRLYPLGPTTYSQSKCMRVGATRFQRELVYTGVANNVVSILYREFTNDLARPAFSQELHYDLGQGSEVGFRGARFEIVRASNTAITYRVLKPLD